MILCQSLPHQSEENLWTPFFLPREWDDASTITLDRSSKCRLRESMPLFNEVLILKLTHIFLAFYPSFMDYHRRIHIDMWTNSARYANSINSTMSPPRRPRCASSPLRLRKEQRSGFSPWVVSLLHGEIWKTHFCVSTTR